MAKKASKATGKSAAKFIADDVKLVGGFGLGAVKGYGGGNGEVLTNPAFLATAVVWVFIVLKFLLRII